jgi:hypothetical protein
VRSLGALYRFLQPGELLTGVSDHAVFRDYWQDASSDAFAPPAHVRALRSSKSH